MEKEVLTLEKVKECHELFKMAFGGTPYVAELAKELDVKATELMRFIVNNQTRFLLTDGEKGTIVSDIGVYLKDKVGTSEWLEDSIEKYKNTIFLDKHYIEPLSDDVGFHYVKQDSFDAYKSNEWRNTADKMNKIKPYLSNKVATIKTFLDFHKREFDNYLSKENIKLLTYQGWKFENYDENAKE